MDLLDPPGLAICLLWGMPYVWGFPTLYPIPSGCYGLAYGIPLPGYGTPYAWLYGTLIPARDWLLGPTGYTLRYAIGGGGGGDLGYPMPGYMGSCGPLYGCYMVYPYIPFSLPLDAVGMLYTFAWDSYLLPMNILYPRTRQKATRYFG